MTVPDLFNDLEQQLAILAGVAERALDIGKVAEAERLLSSKVKDIVACADHASTTAERAALARMRDRLARMLPRLEAVSGKPWRSSLAALEASLARLRGQA